MYNIYADLHVHIGRSEQGKPIKITAARSLNFANIAKECCDRKGINIVLVDAQTGEMVDDVEWTYAPYGNGFLVNTLNYDTESAKQVRVKYNGVLLEETFELIAGNAAEVHTLQPMKPALLYFGCGNIDLFALIHFRKSDCTSAKSLCISKSSLYLQMIDFAATL